MGWRRTGTWNFLGSSWAHGFCHRRREVFSAMVATSMRHAIQGIEKHPGQEYPDVRRVKMWSSRIRGCLGQPAPESVPVTGTDRTQKLFRDRGRIVVDVEQQCGLGAEAK